MSVWFIVSCCDYSECDKVYCHDAESDISEMVDNRSSRDLEQGTSIIRSPYNHDELRSTVEGVVNKVSGDRDFHLKEEHHGRNCSEECVY